MTKPNAPHDSSEPPASPAGEPLNDARLDIKHKLENAAINAYVVGLDYAQVAMQAVADHQKALGGKPISPAGDEKAQVITVERSFDNWCKELGGMVALTMGAVYGFAEYHATHVTVQLRQELEQLQEWKRQAIQVLDSWQSVIDFLQHSFDVKEWGGTWQDAVLGRLTKLRDAEGDLAQLRQELEQVKGERDRQYEYNIEVITRLAAAENALAQAGSKMLLDIRSTLQARLEGRNEGGDIIVMQTVDALVAQAGEQALEQAFDFIENAAPKPIVPYIRKARADALAQQAKPNDTDVRS